MMELALSSISAADPELEKWLRAAGLPTEDLTDAGRAFFKATIKSEETVGYSGIEVCGDDFLIRSIVILPEYRGQKMGAELVNKTLQTVDAGATVYLATTSAADFFKKIGFAVVDRAHVPAEVLSTRQLSAICPASATVMKLNRPPT